MNDRARFDVLVCSRPQQAFAMLRKELKCVTI